MAADDLTNVDATGLVTLKDIDALGLKCPEPVMMLHAAVRKANPGDRLRLLATDPSTQRDVLSFCRFLDHTLIEQTEEGGRFTYVIQKAGG